MVAALGGTVLWFSTLGVFMGSLEKAFGWTRAEIAFGVTLMTLTSPVVAPFAGWVIDRVNLRRIILTCIVCQAGVLGSASFLGSIGSFYALCVAMAVVAYGASVLPLSKIVIAWFDSSRGRALGVLFAFGSLGPVLHPLLAQALIDNVGWRRAYAILGALVLVLGLVTAYFGIRLRTPSATESRTAGKMPHRSLLWLLTDRAWWALALWTALYAFGAGALNLHLYPLMVERGASTTQAAGASSLLGLGLLLGNLVAGQLLDRVPARHVASALMWAPVCATLTLIWVPGVPAGLLASFVLGLAAGGESSALTFLVGRYFNPDVYGRAYATQMVPMALAAGIGPWIAGILRGQSGSYESTLGIAAMAFVLSSLAPLLLPRRS